MRFSKVLATLLIFLLIFPAVAFGAKYGVMAYDKAKGKTAYGTYGYNYVMKSPKITSMHVSSLYVRTSTGWSPMAEIGWYAATWYPSYKKPWFFLAWIKNGEYNTIDLGPAPPGTKHKYKVENWKRTGVWKWYIDGDPVGSHFLDFSKGFSVASSERNILNETNYSHFWNLRYKSWNGRWYNWKDLREFYDNDPGYKLKKFSNTRCQMVKGK